MPAVNDLCQLLGDPSQGTAIWVLAGLLLVEQILPLVPERWIAANSTTGAIANGLRTVAGLLRRGLAGRS